MLCEIRWQRWQRWQRASIRASRSRYFSRRAGVLTGATGATGAADAKFSCRRPSPTVVVRPKDGGQEEAKKVEGEVEEVEEVEKVRNG